MVFQFSNGKLFVAVLLRRPQMYQLVSPDGRGGRRAIAMLRTRRRRRAVDALRPLSSVVPPPLLLPRREPAASLPHPRERRAAPRGRDGENGRDDGGGNDGDGSDPPGPPPRSGELFFAGRPSS